jgi:hypothetical protein
MDLEIEAQVNVAVHSDEIKDAANGFRSSGQEVVTFQ